MEQISNPHDKFFKETLSRQEAAVDFVVHYLPKDIASLLNVDSLEISKDTFVDKELASHLSDLLAGPVANIGIGMDLHTLTPEGGI